MPETFLSQKVGRAAVWMYALRLLSRGLGFVRTIILARLLMPADFGLVGIALMAIFTLESLSQTGFQPALIQKQGNSRTHLDTAWTFMGLRGVLLFAVLYISAPAIARFFSMADVDLLIRVIAISVILTGFRNIGMVSFHKEMQFDKHFRYELSGTLVDLLISIGCALLMRNVWAIVWGGLAGNIVRLVMSYRLSDYRPRLSLDLAVLRELISFGKWVLGTGVVYSLLTQVDSFTIGKILGPSELGYYQIAALIAFLPSSEVAYVLSQITFPAYAAMQNDRRRLKVAYLDVIRFVSLFSVPLGAFILIVAPELIALFLGERWIPAVSCIQILVFSGLAMSLVTTTMPIFSACGKPKYETYLQACNLIILIVLVYPLTHLYGINGTAAAVLAGHATLMVLCVSTASRLIDFRLVAPVKALLLPLVGAIVMGLGLSPVKLLTDRAAAPLQFVLLAVVALVSYGAAIILADRIMGYGIMLLLKEKWNAVAAAHCSERDRGTQ